MNTPQQAALKRRAEKELKQTILDPIWDYLKEDRYVAMALREESLDDLCHAARRLLRLIKTVQDTAAPPPAAERTRRQRRTKTTTLQTEALSKFLADRARADPEIVAFRNQYLQGKLLPYQPASAWIESQVRTNSEAEQRRIVRKSLHPSTSRTKDTGLDLLCYGKLGSVHRLPVGRVAALRHLFCLSRKLSGNFGWQEAHATMFILTDIPPKVPRLQWQVVGVADKKDRTAPPYGCLARLVLIVDPTMPPRELADGYAEIRSKLLGCSRSQTEKHIHLAMFALQHPDCNKDAQLEWNKRHPRWEYWRLNRFRKEANTARRRLELLMEKGSLDFGKSLFALWPLSFP